MFGNTGDDLTNFWGLMGLFGIFLGIAMTVAKGRVRYVFFGFAALSFFLAVFWQPIKTAAPKASALVVAITNDPQSWFTVFVLVLAVLIFRPPKFSRETSGPTSTEDIAALPGTADFDKKIDQIWKFSRAISENLETVVSQTNSLGQKLSDLQTNNIATIEGILRPRQQGLGTGVLYSPEQSRLDQLDQDIQNLHDAISKQNEPLSANIKSVQQAVQTISHAIQARYCKEMLIEEDQKVALLMPKLLAASQEDYKGDGDWRADYSEWLESINVIDHTFSRWDASFHPYLKIEGHQHENASVRLPTESNITADNFSRYKTIAIVAGRYPEGIKRQIEDLDIKSWDLRV